MGGTGLLHSQIGYCWIIFKSLFLQDWAGYTFFFFGHNWLCEFANTKTNSICWKWGKMRCGLRAQWWNWKVLGLALIRSWNSLRLQLKSRLRHKSLSSDTSQFAFKGLWYDFFASNQFLLKTDFLLWSIPVYEVWSLGLWVTFRHL